MSDTINYIVKLASGKGSPERIEATNPKDAAEVFAAQNRYYNVPIHVKRNFFSDVRTFMIQKPGVEQPSLPLPLPKHRVNLPELSLVDMALIAKHSVTHFPFDQFEEVREFLEGSHETRKAITELNEKIRHIYKEFLTEKLVQLSGNSFQDSYFSTPIRKLVDKTMELGVRSVLKRYIPEASSHTSISGGQEIEGRGTWDDLKSRI